MGDRFRLLVVEDSATQALQIQAVLEDAGYEVDVTVDGVAGLEAARANTPDLVVTDLDMPRMNGLELVEALKGEFPRLPVVLTTAKGSEEIAAEALRRGAASYVPKKMLDHDLVPTLRRILAVARADRVGMQLSTLVKFRQIDFEMFNDQEFIPHIVAHLEETIRQMGICDESQLVQVATALDEALVNAITHGNLEVSSELRDVENGRPFIQMIEQRRTIEPYRDRRIHINARTTQEEAVFVIRDEGPGFDPSSIPDPTDPANLAKVSGRGILLITAFMDQVTFNKEGNEITMVKRRA